MALSRKSLAWGITWGSAVALTTGVLVHAFNPQPDPPGHYFGMVGISEGQHASVHVSNRKMMPTEGAFDVFRPEESCQADIRVFDEQGRTMARRTGVIAPGASLSLNFSHPPDPGSPACLEPPDPDFPPGPCRTLVRAAVLFKGKNADHCMSSFEITNRMGMSMGFMNPGSIVGFNPQPDPPGAPTKR